MVCIFLTTSRYPTRRVRSFLKDLVSIIPNSISKNRGSMSLIDVAAAALERGCNKILIVNTWKGNPGKIVLYKLRERRLHQVPPIVYIKGVVLRRELRYSPYKLARVKISSMGYYIDPSVKDADILTFLDLFFSFLEFHRYTSLTQIGEGTAFAHALLIAKSIIKIEVKMRKEDHFVDLGPIIKAVFMDVPKNVQSEK